MDEGKSHAFLHILQNWEEIQYFSVRTIRAALLSRKEVRAVDVCNLKFPTGCIRKLKEVDKINFNLNQYIKHILSKYN